MNGMMTAFYFIIFFFCLNPVQAQEESSEVKNRREQLERQEEEKKRLGEKAHEEGIEKHRDIQTKETKKRMKANSKKAKRHNNNRKEFFLKRWFSFYLPGEKFFLQNQSYIVNCSVKPNNQLIGE